MYYYEREGNKKSWRYLEEALAVLERGWHYGLMISQEKNIYKTENYYTIWQLGKAIVLEHAYQTKELTYHRWWKIPHDLRHPQTKWYYLSRGRKILKSELVSISHALMNSVSSLRFQLFLMNHIYEYINFYYHKK